MLRHLDDSVLPEDLPNLIVLRVREDQPLAQAEHLLLQLILVPQAKILFEGLLLIVVQEPLDFLVPVLAALFRRLDQIRRLGTVFRPVAFSAGLKAGLKIRQLRCLRRVEGEPLPQGERLPLPIPVFAPCLIHRALDLGQQRKHALINQFHAMAIGFQGGVEIVFEGFMIHPRLRIESRQEPLRVHSLGLCEIQGLFQLAKLGLPRLRRSLGKGGGGNEYKATETKQQTNEKPIAFQTHGTS